MEARRALEANPVWYHTIDLAPGVSTPGYVDWRGDAARVLPDDLRGRRALDVGTFDGFWAFEMEKRGASVVAIDVDRVDAAEWPPLQRARLERDVRERDIELGRGFALAKQAKGSSADRVVCDVYDLEPDRIGGRVDFAFMGAVLLHLRDPVGALERVRNVLVPAGELVLCEPVSRRLSALWRRRPLALFQASNTDFNWWMPNVACLAAYLVAAAFDDVGARGRPIRPPSRPEMAVHYAVVGGRAPA